ncbi:Rieske 2Fe-2S domain-containing protein [Sphingomonas colocasiae]|uniref:cholesterol 7-desaturase n=1 Tax=Sphingomonas colocasiae TaxID=1848973 RepID=A0ABS7PQD2_9SPHN|nr:Rieske 2Fe-2S domain-containing protein [Sphingomonas colocasiae]MBY8823537.1 Rieske 2Fe-2S domain-containing protein [Sphingomonas colocasiae]
MNALSRFGTKYPFHPYPTGWFSVGFTDDLAPGAVRPLRYFDTELVLFRTESGATVVTDAHCPHLGAHLGYDSWVEGETIVCPFHQWRYDTSGKCVHVPFAKAIPPRARVRTWPTVERGGMIFVWHDLSGRPPLWDLPVYDESRRIPDAGFRKLHDDFGAAHPQDVFENGVDFAHFPGVHSTGRAVSDGEIRMEGHRFFSPVRILPAGYEGRIDNATEGSTVNSEVVGGGLSRVESRTPHAPGINTIYYVSVTPVDASLSHYYVHQFFLIDDDCPMSRDEIAHFTALAAEHGLREQYSDGKIWPHKAYVAQPMLTSADGPILKYREWYKQFHPAV